MTDLLRSRSRDYRESTSGRVTRCGSTESTAFVRILRRVGCSGGSRAAGYGGDSWCPGHGIVRSESPLNLSGTSREGRPTRVASQRQLEEMAARYDAARAEDLLAAAETLAGEFGETVLLEALLAALNNRLTGTTSTHSAPQLERSSQEEGRQVYAQVDTAGVSSQGRESIRGTSHADPRAQAAPGRAGLRSLLGGRRSSTGLVDESQALANCKPLSTAVLSVSPKDEEEHPPPLMRPRPRGPHPETVREAQGGATGEMTAGSHSPSTWSRNSPASSSGASGGDAA